MSRHLVAPRRVTRRQFLALPLAFLLPPVGGLGRGWAATTSEARKGTYTADVGILYGLLTFHLDGVITAAIDRAAGQRGRGRRPAVLSRRAGAVHAQG